MLDGLFSMVRNWFTATAAQPVSDVVAETSVPQPQADGPSVTLTDQHDAALQWLTDECNRVAKLNSESTPYREITKDEMLQSLIRTRLDFAVQQMNAVTK